MALEDAVVDAGAVRFRPMLLTAAAVVVGASVILFDPIFQGLALSLMAGEVASTVLSRMAVPVLYYLSERGNHSNGRHVHFALPRTGVLDQSLLVSVYRVRWTEPVPVRTEKLVSRDVHTQKTGVAVGLEDFSATC
jgi:hypothetical protein